jgi:hypothetical protein
VSWGSVSPRLYNQLRRAAERASRLIESKRRLQPAGILSRTDAPMTAGTRVDNRSRPAATGTSTRRNGRQQPQSRDTQADHEADDAPTGLHQWIVGLNRREAEPQRSPWRRRQRPLPCLIAGRGAVNRSYAEGGYRRSALEATPDLLESGTYCPLRFLVACGAAGRRLLKPMRSIAAPRWTPRTPLPASASQRTGRRPSYLSPPARAPPQDTDPQCPSRISQDRRQARRRVCIAKSPVPPLRKGHVVRRRQAWRSRKHRLTSGWLVEPGHGPARRLRIEEHGHETRSVHACLVGVFSL